MTRPANWSSSWDWGAYPDTDAKMGDIQLAETAAKALKENMINLSSCRSGSFDRMFRYWFHQNGSSCMKDKIILPNNPKSDLDDLPKNFLSINDYAVAPTHAEVTGSGNQRSLTHAYLASVSFVDHCVGIVLDALEASSYADNTIIVLWSDHGFHLGEKQHWAKRTLWEESTRVPLLISGPGVKPGKACKEPASLLDLYPTLVDMCNLPKNDRLEGISLVPQLKDPTKPESILHYILLFRQPFDTDP